MRTKEFELLEEVFEHFDRLENKEITVEEFKEVIWHIRAEFSDLV